MSGYSVDASIIAQTAAKCATDVMIAEGGFNADRFADIQTAIFNTTLGLAGAESVVEIIESVGNGARGGSNKGGGGNRGGGRPGGSTPSAKIPDNPADFVVERGKHAGKTLATIAGEDQQWLDWAAENLNNDTVRGQVQKYLAAA